MGESTLKTNLAKGLNKGRGLVNKVKGGASKVAEKVTSTKVGGTVAGGLSKVGKAFKFVNKKGGAKELATKMVKSDAVKSVAQKVKKSAAGEGIESMVKKLLSKLIKAYKWVGEKLGKKIGKKVATEAAEAAAEKGIKSAMKKGGSKFVKMITTGIAKITGKIAASASTASIADAAFFTLGAIDYGSKGGTARLFQIDEEYVDAKMRIISTVIGGLLQVSWGAWVDLANELVASFMGINLISELACLLYKAISGKKKDTKLDEARKDFKSDYNEYVDSKIEKAYQKHLEDGTVPKNKDGSEMTLKEFTEAVNRGDITVEHKSFDEYNKEKHKGTWAKAGSAIKKQFSTKKGRKEAAIKGALLLNPLTSGATLAYEGIKKTKVGKAIDKKAKKVTNAAKKKVKELGADISGAAKSAWSSIKGIGKKKKKKNKDAKKFSDMITASSKDLFASSTAKVKDTFGAIKSQSAAILDNAKKSISDRLSKVKGFLAGHKETAWYEQSGSYYVANGDAFDHYNANGDLIDSGVSSDSVSELIDTGILTEGKIAGESGFSAKLKDIRGSLKSSWSSAFKKASLLHKGLKTKIGSMFKNITKNGIIGSIKNAIKGSSKEAWFDPNGNYYVKNGKKYDYYNPNNDLIEKGISADEVEEKIQTGMLTKGTIQKDGSAKAAIKKIQSAVKESWNKAKSVVSSGWKKFKDWISGGSGTGNKNINSIKKSDYGDLSLMFGMGGSGGGRGEDIVNGMPYYSQNDSSWKNMKYGNDGATMGDSGCGPAAMSMIASKLTGQSVSPLETASLAELTGDRDSTGTNWNFIGKASAAYGIDNTQASNPSSGFIRSQLESGHPMILSGASGTGRGGRGGSPYTDAGHYVVATGIDSAGNISVSDPRGKSYNRKYNVNEVADQTGMAWSFGRGGMGGGFGSSYADKVGQVLADLNGPSYTAPINNLSRGQCTWYAEGRAHEKYGWDEFTRRAMGNGGDIYYNAKSWGLDSGTEIKPNSLISRGGSSSYGHVLYVEDVDKENNMVYYSEGNSDGSGNAPDDGVIKSASLDDWNARKPYGYVYTKGSNTYSDADGTGTTSPSDDSSSSSDSSNSSSTGPSTENAISMLTSIFGEAGNRLINGMFTGSFDSDYSSFLSNTSSPDSSSSDSSSSSEDNSGKTMIMVGDSRTVGICAALGGPNIQQKGYVGTAQNDIFIGKVGEGLAWLKSTGIELLKPNASKYVNSYIVIWLGVNDCAMGKPADCGKNYANFINNNIANLNRTVYVVTPAPCKDDGSYDAINKSLPEFNSGLKSGLDSSVHFVDLYNWFKSGIEDGSLVTTDGCHFNNDSYVKIVNKIKSKCGAGGGSGRGRAKVIKTKNTLPNMWIDPSGGRNFITGGGRGNFYVTTDANGGKHYSNPLFNIGKTKFSFSYPNSTSATAALQDAGKQEWNIIKQAGSSTDKTYLGNEYAASTGKAGHRTVRTDNGEMTRWDYTVTVPDSAGGGSKTVQFVKSSDQELAGSKKITSSGIRDLWKRYYSEYVKKKQDWDDKKSRGDEDATETADDIDTEDAENGLPNKWIECVKYVKKVFADELAPKKIVYAWAGHEFDFGSKGKKNFRKDCTGFVSACLWYYDSDTFGFVPSGGWTSHNFGGSNNSPKLIKALEKAGFKRLTFPGWDKLVCGDILIKHEHHGEIYCSGNSADNHQSWNCGSTEGLWKDGTIYGAGYDYEEIWRPPSSAGSESSSGSGASVENAISMMSGIMGEAGNRLINGMFTGKFDTDYSSYLAGTSSDESGSSGSSNGTTVDGSDARSITWNYLIKNGFSKAAAAGTMGNMEGEVAKDYKNNSFPGDNNYVSTAEWEYGQYKSDDDVDDNGGGIIQWTPWKTKIGAYSKEKRGDIHAWTTDLPLQLEYLMSYIGDAIGSGSDYSLSGAGLSKNLVSNLEEFKKMTDVEQATRQWQAGVERPRNDVAHTDRRIGAAKWFYDNMESVKTGGGSGSGARISKPKYGKPWVQGGGGRGDGSSSTYSTPSIDYDNFGTQTDNAINNYKQTISTVKIDDTSAKDELLLKAVEILADIATNTGVASSKLDMLKSLGQKVNQNTFINTGGNTTNNVTTSKDNGSSGLGLTDKGESRNAVLARRIASGV
jgi:lysophospholipase L1-like esterase